MTSPSDRLATQYPILSLQARLHDLETKGEYQPGDIAAIKRAIEIRRELVIPATWKIIEAPHG